MGCHNTCLAICIAVFVMGSWFPHPARVRCCPMRRGMNQSIAATTNALRPSRRPPTASALRRLAMEPIEDNPKLPRVLLIGDSIAMGYTLPLRELLKDKANVHYPTENCHTSQQIVERLDTYLGDKPWDVIHFNCGIHDITFKDDAGHAVKAEQQGKIAVPLDEYRDNLEKIVARLRQTGATLIWCSTHSGGRRLTAPQAGRYCALQRAGQRSNATSPDPDHRSARRRAPPRQTEASGRRAFHDRRLPRNGPRYCTAHCRGTCRAIGKESLGSNHRIAMCLPVHAGERLSCKLRGVEDGWRQRHWRRPRLSLIAGQSRLRFLLSAVDFDLRRLRAVFRLVQGGEFGLFVGMADEAL